MLMVKNIEFPKASELSRFNRQWDLHSHTTFVDGKHSVKEMIDAAEEKGFELFAITEHVCSTAMKWWNDYVKEIQEQRKGRRIQVLIGMEANAIGPAGTVDVTEEMWRDAELVLGAVHGYYDDDTWAKIEDGSLPKETALAYEIEKSVGLCHNPKIHVLAHPSWLFEKYYGEMPEDELRVILRAAKETSTAVELNGWYSKNLKKFLKVLFEENPSVSFGSNAHAAQDIRSVLSYTRELILL